MTRTTSSLPLFAIATLVAPLALLVGCAGEPARTSESTVVPVDAGAPETAPRQLRSAPLLPSSVDNVLIDPGFSASLGQPTWGHWLGIDASGNQLAFGVLLQGATPLGVRAPVATIPSTPAKTGAGKPFDLLAAFPGGTGAATARVWVSRNDAAGQPIAFEADGSPLTISVIGLDAFTSGKGVDLARDDAATQVIAGRTWYLYRGEIPSGLDYEGFLDVSVTKTEGNFWLTGAEVVPASLAPLPAPMALKLAKPRELLARERAALAAYHRLTPPLHASPRQLRKLARPE